jgi:transcriptional regulator with XRE-family HTH domain
VADLSPRGERLRRELMHVRDQAGLSGRKLADRMDTNQGKVWRIESGTQLPSVPVVKSWLTGCGLEPDSDRWQRIVDLAEAAHGETRPWGDLLAGVTHLQGVARQRETEAGRVRNFQPTIVPALLQTPEYAARIIPLTDITGAVDHSAALADRLERQQVLYEEGHAFEFLLVETALRWSVDVGVLVPAQLDRIVSLAKLPSVSLAVVPAGGDVVVPWHNFVIWEPGDDESYVTIELFDGERRVTELDRVKLFQTLWERMWSAALVGDEAVDMIRAVT